MKLLFEISGSDEKYESRALARALQHAAGACPRCCAEAHCLRQVWTLIKAPNEVKEEEENETKEMSTELEFTCWPHSKPRLGSVC